MEDESIPVELGRVHEACGFKVRGELETCRIGYECVPGKLRFAFVGFVCVVNRLVFGYAHCRVPICRRVIEPVVLRQNVVRVVAQTRREIVEEVIVGNAVVVDAVAEVVPAAAQIDVCAVAMVAVLAVMRQVLTGNFALKMLGEEAEFVAEHHAALGDDLRRECVVVVRRDIEVVRD